MGILYEISSLTAPVMSQPNISSQCLGSLSQGNQIDVLSFSESWANFKYNNNDAYVNISNLKIVGNEVKGSITLKYIDINTNNEIYCSKILSNLELGNHSYNSKTIYGYKLQSDSAQSVNLTADNLNQSITFYYKQVLGSITIKYVDTNKGTDIYESQTIENLTLGTYTYESINISNYILNDDEIKTVTITEASPNATITFKYNTLLGNITIKYLDSSTLSEIFPSTIISNIAFGSYTYDALYIDNYEIDGDSSISITLTTTNPNEIISFKYKKIEIPKDLNLNEVPYISTYYIKPIVNPGEEVFIDYYITDYYQKEYIEEDYSETFTITVRVEGQDDKLYHYLKAGDHQVSLGSFNNEGEQKFSILCTDKYGRNSHELFKFFLVQDDISHTIEYIMTEKDLITYNIKNDDKYENNHILVNLSSNTFPTVDSEKTIFIRNLLSEYSNNITIPPKSYTCFLGDIYNNGRQSSYKYVYVKYSDDYDKSAVMQESTNTRIGLQKLLNDKKSEGYNKLKLLPGVYRIDHCVKVNESTGEITGEETISIPTEFTLDMNGSTLKQNQFAGSSTQMLALDNTYNSHVINGIIEGDFYTHDYDNSPNSSEWVNGIGINSSSRYSSYENIYIKDITGYGGISGGGASKDGKVPIYYVYPGWKDLSSNAISGDIDRKTGALIDCKDRVVSDFMDIGDFNKLDYLVISPFLGYGGIPGDIWNFICHFYDENKKFIKSIDGLQYRLMQIPKNSKYIRITSLGLNKNWSTINLSRFPIHCAFKNIKFENCRCVGLAQSQMNDMLVENCEFSFCGQSAARCSYDAEDGWEAMQDVTIKNNNFHDNYVNDFLTCAGQNFIIDGMQNGQVYFWGRSNSYAVKNCINLTGAYVECGGKNISTAFNKSYIRFYNNTINNGTVQLNTVENGYLFKNVIKDCVINTRPSGSISKNMYLRCTIGKNILNSNDIYLNSLYNSIGSGMFKNCIINDKNGGKSTSNCIFDNCTINNSKILALGNITFYNSTTNNLIIEESNPDYSINFINCNMIESSFIVNYWNTISDTLIDNCIITNKNYLLKLPHYSLKKVFCLKNSKIICSGTNGVIWLYDDRTNTKDNSNLPIPSDAITLDSNYIESTTSKYIITGLSDTTINTINILYKNNTLKPMSLLLLNPISQQNTNITVLKD